MWDPCGSGRNEKAIFTWFASRPIAQARAAVLCSLLTEKVDEGDDRLRELVTSAVLTGDAETLDELAARIPDVEGKRPVVLDCFSGRGIIPLEAARLGLRSVGTDLSPVAVLASRLLADWALRDWSAEPGVPFASDSEESEEDGAPALFVGPAGEAKLIQDLRRLFAEVGRADGESSRSIAIRGTPTVPTRGATSGRSRSRVTPATGDFLSWGLSFFVTRMRRQEMRASGSASRRTLRVGRGRSMSSQARRWVNPRCTLLRAGRGSPPAVRSATTSIHSTR